MNEKKVKPSNTLYLVFIVLFSIIGMIQFIRWYFSFGMPFPNSLLAFLPATALIISYLLKSRTKKKQLHVVAFSLCLIAFLYWAFVSCAIELLIKHTAEVTNTKKYEHILEVKWKNSSLVEHFPKPIPSDAKNIKFSYLPRFLQGGCHIQLRYSTNASKIAELYDLFSKKKTKSFWGGSSQEHMNMDDGMPTTCFYTSNSGIREFTGDYEIMIFDEVLKKEDRPKGFYWNHGQSHGVAISKNRNEIVYWADFW